MSNLAAIPQRVEPRVVDAFERLLDMARRGEIVGFAVSYEMPGNQIGSESNFNDGIALLGHLSRQASLVNRAMDESAE